MYDPLLYDIDNIWMCSVDRPLLSEHMDGFAEHMGGFVDGFVDVLLML